jgi:hypothetical protein
MIEQNTIRHKKIIALPVIPRTDPTGINFLPLRKDCACSKGVVSSWGGFAPPNILAGGCLIETRADAALTNSFNKRITQRGYIARVTLVNQKLTRT